MNVLVVGSGGREHAICLSFSKSAKVSKVFCAPGNAGIASIAESVPIAANDVKALADFALSREVGVTFVGGETPLALGIVDEFQQRGLRIIGPSKAAARLEASKAFAKDFMARHGIPTAKYVTAHSPGFAVLELESGDFGDASKPVVVKADGLAAGKGVVIAKDRNEAVKAINDLTSLVGSAAANKIVLEEFLFGKEVSLLMFCDGENFALMPPTRDHKRIGDGDTGPNTGGMGTFTDSALLSDDQLEDIVERIIKPTLHGCKKEEMPFRGILFLGLMMAPDGPKLLEYNVRFGDPETQSILVRLKTDLVDICDAITERKLSGTDIKWRPGNSATVVLAAEGYPQEPRKGDVISGLDEAAKLGDVTIFQAGTAKDANGSLVTAGGRVLGVTASAESLEIALDRAYNAVGKISWNGMQFRGDIGKSND